MKVLADCFTAVRRGGFVSILGAYGTPFDNFPLGQWFDKGLGVRTGQAPVHNYIDSLLQLVEQGKVTLDDVITHRVSLDQVTSAYSMFNRKEDGCVKVVLRP
jgi:S-(hydroxymethyl)glutathione dehydrogenase/alcohol dehydrogenase